MPDSSDFGLALLNSFIVATRITVSVASSPPWPVSRSRSSAVPGPQRSLSGILAVTTSMVPPELGIIPLYILMAQRAGPGTCQRSSCPRLVTAFGVFFMTPVPGRAVPDRAAGGRPDRRLHDDPACSGTWCCPPRPAAAVLGLFTFMHAWNDFFWPLVVLAGNPTVQVALSTLASGYAIDYRCADRAPLIATVPLLVVFLVLGRQIIGGIMQGAVKG